MKIGHSYRLKPTGFDSDWLAQWVGFGSVNLTDGDNNAGLHGKHFAITKAVTMALGGVVGVLGHIVQTSRLAFLVMTRFSRCKYSIPQLAGPCIASIDSTHASP